MLMENVRTGNLASRELADAVKRLQKMTDGRYDVRFYKDNGQTLMQVIKKIMRLSKQEKEWYVYFLSLYESIHVCHRSGQKITAIKYAEIFYRDSALYMDRVLPNYPDTDMKYLNIYMYSTIFDNYFQFYQIDDNKMNKFMEMYEAAALKYGRAYMYYNCEMEMGILYHDLEIAEHGRYNFEKYEHEMNNCYVCNHRRYLGYYLLRGDIDRAEKLMQDFRQRRIPKKYQWCYDNCELAQEDYAMYYEVLGYTLRVGSPEAFRLFYGKYWLTLPKEKRRESTLFVFFCAIAGDFDELEEQDLRMAEKDVRECGRMTTLGTMMDSLNWMCYFRLLDRSGIKEVMIDLPGLLGNDNGKTDSLAISTYFEQRADEEGMKFGLARAKFDYAMLKNTCLECAGLL